MMHAHVKIIPKGTMRIRLAQPILDEILNIFLVMALYHIFTPSWDNFRCVYERISAKLPWVGSACTNLVSHVL